MAFARTFQSVARGPFAAAGPGPGTLLGAAEHQSRAARLRIALIQVADGLQRTAPDGPDLRCQAVEQLICQPEAEPERQLVLQVLASNPEAWPALRTTVLARRGGRWVLEPLPPG